jgi:hypothetical protein
MVVTDRSASAMIQMRVPSRSSAKAFSAVE